MDGLRAKKVSAGIDITLKTIAEQNKMGPDEVYDPIKQIAAAAATVGKADSPAAEPAETSHTEGTPQGLGLMTLTQACEHLGLGQQAALKKPAAKGIKPEPGDGMRSIADIIAASALSSFMKGSNKAHARSLAGRGPVSVQTSRQTDN